MIKKANKIIQNGHLKLQLHKAPNYVRKIVHDDFAMMQLKNFGKNCSIAHSIFIAKFGSLKMCLQMAYKIRKF